MSSRLIPVATLLLLFGIARADVSAPSIPDTAAGHALSAWLDAFNSGDRAIFESFERAHAPWLITDGELGLRARTGGYQLLGIDKSEKLWLTFHVREKASLAQVVGALVVRSNDPDHISMMSLAPASVRSAGISIDDGEISRIIEGAAKLLEEFYVFPETARRIAADLEKLQKRGDYRGITDGEILATRLSDDLQALSADKHMQVDFFAQPMPGEAPARPHPDPHQLAARNCSFESAEHYPPNIGYLKLIGFADPDICAPTAVAAMNFLADSDALIIDLRENHGGAPGMAALISSYLFDEPTHLDDLYDHHENTTEQLWTLLYVPGKKFIGKPVFVLTSGESISAAELFSYDLQVLHRATIIGETTAGGAHPTAPHRIDDHFFIRVPFGRSINPITKTNWQGTGVQPDVKAAAADALDEALKRAREQFTHPLIDPRTQSSSPSGRKPRTAPHAARP